MHQYDLEEHLKLISRWQKAKRVIAVCQRYVLKLKEKITEYIDQETACFTQNSKPMSTQEVQKAEHCIIRELQKQAYPEERKALIEIRGYPKDCAEANQRNNAVKHKSSLFQLDPFVSDDELMRGRQNNTSRYSKKPCTSCSFAKGVSCDKSYNQTLS